MGERYLTMLEVSRKQAYIFQSNELKKNIRNSAVIAWVMDADYLEEKAADRMLFNREDNLVYSGGGHIVLEFPTREQAVAFTRVVTRAVRDDYPGIDMFAKTILYEDKESPADNIKRLTEALEKKKAERRSAFHQGSFGVERIDTNTLEPVLDLREAIIPEKEEETDKNLIPAGYNRVFKFEELGGSKNQSNFIAVVHIDGNAMGKRVERLQRTCGDADWEAYKGKLREFSRLIDRDFKAAYRNMAECVADGIKKGCLEELSLKDNYFPVRRIITAGDDICFVSEGRIGLECAAAFLRSLSDRTNEVDGENYAACAGVAIVHQKYPFYKAYELAEMLCANAKRSGAALSRDGFGSDVSMMDWHVEFGEVGDTLEEVRAAYLDADGNSIIGRPYLVSAPKSAEDAGYSDYREVRRLIWQLKQDDRCARGTLKELRNVLKRGRDETAHFIRFHRIDEVVKWEFGENLKLLFDAIELVDTFVALEDREGSN